MITKTRPFQHVHYKTDNKMHIITYTGVLKAKIWHTIDFDKNFTHPLSSVKVCTTYTNTCIHFFICEHL